MKRTITTLLLLLAVTAARAACTAGFTYNVTPIYSSLYHLVLTNTSTFSGPSNYQPQYSVNYGDGSAQTPSFFHDYANTGTYTVKLYLYLTDTSNNSLYCMDSTQHTVTIAPVSCGTTFSYTLGSGGQVTFTANTPGGNAGMIYNWTFGDATSGTGSPVTHTYATNGTKQVTLTAVKPAPNPCTYTINAYIFVNNAVVVCNTLHAQFGTGTTGSTVTFNNSSTNSPPLTRTALWDFGDGGTSILISPTHTYANPGTYTVKLRMFWTDANNTFVCSDSINHNVTIAQPQNVIYGYVVTDSNQNSTADTFKVWLIQFDSVTNMLSAVDSTTAWGYFMSSYHFSNKPAGNYLTKAKLLSGPTSGWGYVPTYHDSSLYWSAATNIAHAGGTTAPVYIFMKHGIITSGPGFIGGNVSLGANKGTGAGVEKMLVLLRDYYGVLVASAYTDANGNFSFNNVPLGVYSVYPEAMNYATTPYGSIVVTASQVAVPGINFNQDDMQMNIKPRTTGVGQTPATAPKVVIFPNPAKGLVTLSWQQAAMQNGQVMISNLTGQVVYTSGLGEGNASSKEINLSSLQPGIYFIHVKSAQMDVMQKLVVQP